MHCGRTFTQNYFNNLNKPFTMLPKALFSSFLAAFFLEPFFLEPFFPSAEELVPVYLRMPQAERERLQKQNDTSDRR